MCVYVCVCMCVWVCACVYVCVSVCVCVCVLCTRECVSVYVCTCVGRVDTGGGWRVQRCKNGGGEYEDASVRGVQGVWVWGKWVWGGVSEECESEGVCVRTWNNWTTQLIDWTTAVHYTSHISTSWLSDSVSTFRNSFVLQLLIQQQRPAYSQGLPIKHLCRTQAQNFTTLSQNHINSLRDANVTIWRRSLNNAHTVETII